MTEEESLAKAYLEFSLEGGSSLEEVNEAYKDLVMAWHSDRYPVGKKRQKAEEKMKKINNARDLLKKHFSESHKATGYCACRGAGNSVKPKEKQAPVKHLIPASKRLLSKIMQKKLRHASATKSVLGGALLKPQMQKQKLLLPQLRKQALNNRCSLLWSRQNWRTMNVYAGR